ncbi:MAG: heavy-metal-associated domain-containing protein [Ignavibacteria bacterium]|jgi:copper chaperone CopZ
MIKTAEIRTEGMSCVHCENTIKIEVGKIDGVKDVSANYKANIAKVTFDSDITDIKAIENTITEWGFKVINVEEDVVRCG